MNYLKNAVPVLIILALSCSTEIEFKNPYDLRTPLALQAKGSIYGIVKKEDELYKENDRQNHSSISVLIEGLSHLRAETKKNGTFTIYEVPAGMHNIIASYHGDRYEQGYKTDILIQLSNDEDKMNVTVDELILQAPPDRIQMDKAEVISDNEIKVNWKPSDAKDLAGYRVYIKSSDPDDKGFEQIDLVKYTHNESEKEIEVYITADCLIDEKTGNLTKIIGSLRKDLMYTFEVNAVDKTNLESKTPYQNITHFIYPNGKNSNIYLKYILNLRNILIADCNDNKCLYGVGDRSNGLKSLYKINLETEIQSNISSIENCENVIDICSSPDNKNIYILCNMNQDENYIVKLSSMNETEIGRRLVSRVPHRFTISDNGSNLFVAFNEPAEIQVFETSLENAGSTTNPKQIGVENLLITINDLFEIEGLLYISINQLMTILIYDSNSDNNTFMDKIGEIPVGSNPMQINSSVNTDYLLVTNSDSNDVSIINRKNLNYEKSINVGRHPYGIHLDNNLAYITNKHDDSISIISLTTLQLLECSGSCRFTTGSNPHSTVVSDNVLYISNEQSPFLKVFHY